MAKKKHRAEKAEASVKEAKPRKKINWLLYIAVVAFVIYIAVTIVDQNVRIISAKHELNDLNNQIDLMKIKNEDLKRVADAAQKDDLDSISDFIEKIAREDMDYVKSGEVEYINIAGD